ncbi:piggyBac transposable element-derived protein 4 [Nephila pilipes]|uniref:PiggyBac transposable element-derived protein 4 n=1 Tax=Nephila pilipes TaxID=299642 RepID=A0A8X6PEC8_NEPPI|nr:piggyBac transposable element-derived protein 4 [Nephila pilipes]
MGKNHRVFMDNYFSSYNLFRFLNAQNLYARGTVNMKRKDLPKNLKEDKFMSRGGTDITVSDYSICCIKWKDKKSVCVLSCLEKAAEMNHVDRKDRDDAISKVLCQNSTISYSINTGYVYLFN